MHIHLAVYYICNDHRVKQAGTFQVNRQAYKENKEQETAHVAAIFIRQIAQNYPTRIELIKVICNDKWDITNQVKHKL